MLLGLTKGEIALVVFIFALIYMAGLLPKVVKLIVGREDEDDPSKKPEKNKQSKEAS
jgi:hypothetical protein